MCNISNIKLFPESSQGLQIFKFSVEGIEDHTFYHEYIISFIGDEKTQ